VSGAWLAPGSKKQTGQMGLGWGPFRPKCRE